MQNSKKYNYHYSGDWAITDGYVEIAHVHSEEAAIMLCDLLSKQDRDEDQKNNNALRAFAQDVMESWPFGDVDGGYLQQVAEKHGLLKPETRTQLCREDCGCVGLVVEGEQFICYRKTELLTGNEKC